MGNVFVMGRNVFDEGATFDKQHLIFDHSNNDRYRKLDKRNEKRFSITGIT